MTCYFLETVICWTCPCLWGKHNTLNNLPFTKQRVCDRKMGLVWPCQRACGGSVPALRVPSRGGEPQHRHWLAGLSALSLTYPGDYTLEAESEHV